MVNDQAADTHFLSYQNPTIFKKQQLVNSNETYHKIRNNRAGNHYVEHLLSIAEGLLLLSTPSFFG